MRVLIVDDSAFMRKMLSQMLSSDPSITVVDTARDGQEGLEKVKQHQPDLVTLDIEMPVMDGLTALRAIRREPIATRPAVLMCSTLTTQGSIESMRAMQLGAADFFPKDVGAFVAGAEGLKADLLAKVKAICETRSMKSAAPAARATSGTTTAAGAAAPVKPARTIPFDLSQRRFEVLLIGSSTGGPPVLEEILNALPKGYPLGVVVAQHMPPLFTKSLADRLASTCKMPVVHAEANMPLEPGTIYITQGGKHSRVRRAGVQLELEISHHPAEALYKPSVNELFMSASKLGDNGALAVVLTGMGDDGAKGAQELVSAGGLVLAQNMETSVVYGMPRAVVERGIAAAALSPALIAESLNTYPAKAMAA